VAPAELIRNPLLVAPVNLRLLGEYVRVYLTLPLAAAAVAGLAYLAYKRSAAALVIVSVSCIPLLLQVFLLRTIPTRYPFPHFWPWLVVLAMAVAAVIPRRQGLLFLALGVVALPAIMKSLCLVRTPRDCLHSEDAQTFLGSGPPSGYGIPEAVQYLKNEARQAPLVVFTDAVWGPPADAMFAYLNERSGIRVYEAWWTTISPEYPIIPPAPVEVVKSQYERVPAGLLDARTLSRIYYVTETHYNPPAAVRKREPAARHLVSFFKPNGINSIDIYRLR